MDAPCCERALLQGKRDVVHCLIPILKAYLAQTTLHKKAFLDMMRSLMTIHPDFVNMLDLLEDGS